MPWSSSNTIPAIQGKSLALRKLFADVANAALEKGRTEQEAIFAGLAAVKNEEKKTAKKDYTVAKQVLKPPSHLQAIIDASKKKQEQVEVKKDAVATNINRPVIRQEFLPANSLEIGVERNVVYADFDDNGQLVILFDNGDKIVTDSVEQRIENYVNIVNEQITGGAGGGGGANIKHFDTALSGLSVTILKTEHRFEEIISIYFLKNNKEVSLDWEFDIQAHILYIRSNLDMQGIKLIAHGKG